MSEGSTTSSDRFKPRFKYYKSRVPPPKLDEVLDYRKNDSSVCQELSRLDPSFTNSRLVDDVELEALGLAPISSWQLFSVTRVPGLILIKNPFSDVGQFQWATTCLRDYARNPPHRTNLDQQETRVLKAGSKRKADDSFTNKEDEQR